MCIITVEQLKSCITMIVKVDADLIPGVQFVSLSADKNSCLQCLAY